MRAFGSGPAEAIGTVFRLPIDCAEHYEKREAAEIAACGVRYQQPDGGEKTCENFECKDEKQRAAWKQPQRPARDNFR
jgi:hypothetical protein